MDKSENKNSNSSNTNNSNNSNNNNNNNNDNKNNNNNNTKTTNILSKYLGKGNFIEKNINKIFICFLLLLFFIIVFFLSSSFRNQKTISYLKAYPKYQTISNLDIELYEKDKLLNFYISSSFNPCHTKRPIYDYTNVTILKEILQCGPRYLDIMVFNSKFGNNAQPVISYGYKKGEWKLTLNHISFYDFCKTISEHAFTPLTTTNNNVSSGSPNFEDPLFVSLNLATQRNIKVLNIMADIIQKFFSSKLLSRKYRNISNGFSDITMSELKGKIVFFSSSGYQGSSLKELINATWEGQDSTIKRINYKYLEQIKSVENGYSDDEKKFIEETKKKLHIVVPNDESNIKAFGEQNYDTNRAFRLGCQFISVNYQSLDKFMDDYITKFKNNGIIKKTNPILMLKMEEKPKEEVKNDASIERYRRKMIEAIDELREIRS